MSLIKNVLTISYLRIKLIFWTDSTYFWLYKYEIFDTLSLKKIYLLATQVQTSCTGKLAELYATTEFCIEVKIIEPLIFLWQWFQSPALRSLIGNDIKEISLSNGALACGISGSGPSIFALSKGFSTANDIALAMKKVYSKTDLEYDIHISPINDEGIKIIKVK